MNRFLRCLAAMLLLFSLGGRAAAYDEDTHFGLSYLAARLLKLRPERALEIASANVSIDRNHNTSCFIGKGTTVRWWEKAEDWHAMRFGLVREVDEGERRIDDRLGSLMERGKSSS